MSNEAPQAAMMRTAPLLISIRDHYWKIGDEADYVYSSARNIMVSAKDPDYLAWAEGSFVTPIASEQELATVLRDRGTDLPEWLLSSPSFIQHTPDAYTKDQLRAYAEYIAKVTLASIATLDERVRALELAAHGNSEVADDLFAKTNAVYAALDDTLPRIKNGTVSTLDQVSASFG